jgi:hypothetical protein
MEQKVITNNPGIFDTPKKKILLAVCILIFVGVFAATIVGILDID